MGDAANLPDDGEQDRDVITEGWFEREVELSRAETASFLHELADQIEAESRVTVSSTDWEIPFAFREPIEVEVEFAGGADAELEIELEFEHARDGGGLDVS